MAIQEHLDRLEQGSTIWNEWRAMHPETQPDLSGADLSGADLSEANLSRANLFAANLSYANLFSLRGANLREAKLGGAHLYMADLNEANLAEANLVEADLSEANLSRANLSGADLNGADLREADLREADLSRADLSRADLSGATLLEANLSKAGLFGAHLSGADLSGANLREADLSRTNLSGADLTEAILITTDLVEADLTEANLSRANLNGADLAAANLSAANLSAANLSAALTWDTIFANVDLSTVKGLATVNHGGPSSIGIDTIYRSQGKIPERFLQDAGVSNTFIDSMHTLVGQPIQYFTCFISHSHKDQHFCDRLKTDLRHHDVPSWYVPEDAVWGISVWGEIDRSIKPYDKLVVVCSQDSLQSGPVLREIERALQREDREGKHILFLLRLDNYLFDQWEHERKADILSKVVGDFRSWNRSAEKYDTAFQRFLKALKAQEETTKS